MPSIGQQPLLDEHNGNAHKHDNNSGTKKLAIGGCLCCFVAVLVVFERKSLFGDAPADGFVYNKAARMNAQGSSEFWLKDFGSDSFKYPEFINAQRLACKCDVQLERGRSVTCTSMGAPVDWRQAKDIDFCVAKHWMLEHMPEFDLHYLPPSVSVDGDSMMDDNIAFTLMALNLSALDPAPPVSVRLAYLLPYASFHEGRQNWRPIFFAKYFDGVAGGKTGKAVLAKLLETKFMNWAGFTPRPNSSHEPKRAEEYVLSWGGAWNEGLMGPLEHVAQGYQSCTGWAIFLSAALKSVGVPSRVVSVPCWNDGDWKGLAVDNPKVSECWKGNPLRDHGFVEYWDNEVGDWTYQDIDKGPVCCCQNGEIPLPPAPFTDGSRCAKFSRETGCSCSSSLGPAMRDHPVLASTWSYQGESDSHAGGEVMNVSDIVLSTGEKATPLVWATQMVSVLGDHIPTSELRLVNRTDFYRCH